MNKETKLFLEKLNTTYAKLHENYENFFWLSYMGDHSIDEKMKEALTERDTFRANRDLFKQVIEYKKKASQKDKERLAFWQLFFEKYQMPEKVL